MSRAAAASLAIAAAIAGTSCASAVQHPTAAAAIVGGAVALGTCEADSVGQGTCAITGAAGAIFLGGITALVYLITDQPPPPQMIGEEVPPEERAPPRPGQLSEEPLLTVDAGVAPVADAAATQ